MTSAMCSMIAMRWKCSSRSCPSAMKRKSVMITTNLVFSEWDQIFKNPMTTMAAIDRVVHHSVILDMMEVESYRATEANHHRKLQENPG